MARSPTRMRALACHPLVGTNGSLSSSLATTLLSSRFLPKIPSKFRRNSSLSRAQAPFEFRDREPIRSESGDLARFDETTIVRRNVRGRGDGWLLPTATSLPCRRHEPHPRTTRRDGDKQFGTVANIARRNRRNREGREKVIDASSLDQNP